MNSYILSLLVIGLLLLAVTLGSGWIERLPLSYALIYLVVGVLLGSYGFGLIQIRPDTQFLERLTEFVVIISVFGCGLKINRPLKLWAWRSTIRLIGLLMPLSIGAIALLAHYAIGLDWGAAVLLGAILAPTDPVLAGNVQVGPPNAGREDEVRFGLSLEAGLNDGLAFPFVYLALNFESEGVISEISNLVTGSFFLTQYIRSRYISMPSKPIKQKIILPNVLSFVNWTIP